MFVQLQKPFELTTGFLSEKGNVSGATSLFGFLEGKGDERMTNTFISTEPRRAALSETVASGGAGGGGCGWDGGGDLFASHHLESSFCFFPTPRNVAAADCKLHVSSSLKSHSPSVLQLLLRPSSFTSPRR